MSVQHFIPIDRVKYLMRTCARYFDEKASEREIDDCIGDLLGAEAVESGSAELQATASYYAGTLRRELAEKILLKLIEIAPAMFELDSGGSSLPAAGAQLAWVISDAFLKAEGAQS